MFRRIYVKRTRDGKWAVYTDDYRRGQSTVLTTYNTRARALYRLQRMERTGLNYC